VQAQSAAPRQPFGAQHFERQHGAHCRSAPQRRSA
jgi:hypothetical protein